jgi:hypothetical protein
MISIIHLLLPLISYTKMFMAHGCTNSYCASLDLIFQITHEVHFNEGHFSPSPLFQSFCQRYFAKIENSSAVI